MATTKHDVENFDGKTNFSVWHTIVKYVLVQQRLLKALQEKKLEVMKDDKQEELKVKVMGTIQINWLWFKVFRFK